MKLLSNPVFYVLLPWLLFIFGSLLILSSVIRNRLRLQSKLYEKLRFNEKAKSLAKLRSQQFLEEIYYRKVYEAKLIPLPPLKPTKASQEILQAIDKFQDEHWVIYRDKKE